MGRYRGEVNNIRYNVNYNSTNDTRGALQWAAASTLNAGQEYNFVRAPAELIGTPPNKLRILLLPGRGSGAAPMFAKRNISSVSNYYYKQFIAPPIGGDYSISLLNSVIAVLASRLDVIIGFSGGGTSTKKSDRLSELCFHEFTHAAHYNKVGDSWYNTFVQSEINQIIVNLNGSYSPYGQSNSSDASIIALGESWAYHLGHYLTYKKYGASSGTFYEQLETYSNNSPVFNLTSNQNLLEDFSPTRTATDVFAWIPQGLYYDLLDDRNDGVTPPVRVLFSDQVSSYTNQHFFNAMASDISNLASYKTRLLSQNSNRDAAGVNTIFSFYGY